MSPGQIAVGQFVSNGVIVRMVEPKRCQNCSVNQAARTIVDRGRALEVCFDCLRANDGRGGWPYVTDVRDIGIVPAGVGNGR